MTMEKSNDPLPNKQRDSKLKIWIVTVCIGCIILLGYFNINFIVMGYYYITKFDHFDHGDKVYVSQAYFNNKNVTAVGTMELIRPLKKEDLDTLGYTYEEKLKILTQLNDTLKPYLKYLGPVFDKDNMRPFKSGFIGIFKGYKIRYVKDVSGKYYVMAIYAIIKPNKKVFVNDYLSMYKPPENYILADSDIYVFPLDISKKELAEFTKK